MHQLRPVSQHEFRVHGVHPRAPRAVGAFHRSFLDQVKAHGRMFELGKNEVIVGFGAAREFAGLDLGATIKVGREAWPIVGVFSAGGGLAESDIWTDA